MFTRFFMESFLFGEVMMLPCALIMAVILLPGMLKEWWEKRQVRRWCARF